MRKFYRKLLFLDIVIVCCLVLLILTGKVTWNGALAEQSVMVQAGSRKDASEADKEAAQQDPYQENKKAALTFDDGPDPRYTEKLLDGLKERNVRATFFVLGKQAEKYPEIVARMQEEGHLIGNHTYSHMQLRKSNREEFKEELKQTSEIISDITGEELQYVRPPYGSWDKSFESELNMFPVLWTVDPRDWCKSDASCIVRNVVSKVQDGDIILLHDQYDSSVRAALKIVDELKERGYEFVTVEELLVE